MGSLKTASSLMSLLSFSSTTSNLDNASVNKIPTKVPRGTYEYDALPGARMIRLLRVHRDETRTDGLTVSLTPVELGAAPPFYAVSYTWGPPRLSSHSESAHPPAEQFSPLVVRAPAVDKARKRDSLVRPLWAKVTRRKQPYIWVGENLRNFLVHVCKTPEWTGRYFWADAICIDQNDQVHRAKQVAMMGDIYTAAQKVLVWLGKEEPHADVSWVFQEFIPRIVEVETAHGTEYLESIDPECTPPDSKGIIGERMCERWQRTWLAWTDFIADLAWFTRGWVIQETTLKAEDDVVMLCGSQTYSWRDLQWFIAISSECKWRLILDNRANKVHGRGPGTIWRTHKRVRRSQRARNVLTESVENIGKAVAYDEITFAPTTPEEIWLSRVHNMLAVSRGMSFGDDRDHIFGYVGLFAKFLPEGMENLIVPDYEITVEEAYKRASVLFLTRLPLLSHLSRVSGSMKRRRYPNLPTWVQDYSVSPGINHFQTYNSKFRSRRNPSGISGALFDASLTKSTRDPPRPVVDGDALILHGAMVDTIAEPLICYSQSSFLERVLNLCARWDTYAGSSAREPQAEAVLRTIIADAAFLEADTDAFLTIGREWLALSVADGLQRFQAATTTATAAGTGRRRRGDPLLARLLALQDSHAGARFLPTLAEVDALRRGPAPLSNQRLKNRYHEEYLSNRAGRGLFTTARGYVGLGPGIARPGDEAWILQGGKVLFVLRPVVEEEAEGEEEAKDGDEGQQQKTEKKQKRYNFVGDCYLHGAMYGEMMTDEFRERMGPVVLV
ncbi:uncharacterized protein E0L32_000454 [Thyridium curvatum]|uniref:Heterokaryon incompatibility domain-containing protein n=1 Tax=Thyridium curvatum TaxID=1093900 RepID=A0A507BBS3_9PEZI|nr:uncharacterized protein E0L32_000454 [Thyridium curvatum]TPX14060.1 hypothetical protein E0L32_000454 [Thyridium curvatum]